MRVSMPIHATLRYVSATCCAASAAVRPVASRVPFSRDATPTGAWRPPIPIIQCACSWRVREPTCEFSHSTRRQQPAAMARAVPRLPTRAPCSRHSLTLDTHESVAFTPFGQTSHPRVGLCHGLDSMASSLMSPRASVAAYSSPPSHPISTDQCLLSCVPATLAWQMAWSVKARAPHRRLHLVTQSSTRHLHRHRRLLPFKPRFSGTPATWLPRSQKQSVLPGSPIRIFTSYASSLLRS